MPTRLGSSRWSIDPMHSAVGFTVRHLLITNVQGGFDSLTGSAVYEPGQIEGASIVVEIPVASIDTRVAQRDEHLRSADFFDAAQHPTVVFRSTRVTKNEIVGALTLRGVTREVVLALSEFTDPIVDHRGLTRFGASATTVLKRSEFGMTFNRALETGGLAIGDEIRVALDLSLVRDAEPISSPA